MVVHYALALDLGPLDLVWLAVLITAGGHVTPLAALVPVACWRAASSASSRSCAPAGGSCSSAEPEPIRTRGPIGYAGPGSLGGTESALKR